MGFAITPINVRSARAVFNGVNVSVEDLQGEVVTDRVEITGTEDQRADGRTPQNLTTGIDSVKFSFTMTVDTANMPAAGPGLTQGAVVAIVMQLDKNIAARKLGVSHALVLSCKYMGRIKDAWKFQLSVESTGGADCVITLPT